MKRLERKIFLSGILLTILAGGLAGCKDGYRLVHEDGRETGADVRLSNFRRHATRADGRPLWYLIASEAYIFNTDGPDRRIVAYDFDLQQYDQDGKPSGVVTAKKGEINDEKNLIQLEGNVVFVGEDGRRIESGSLNIDTETNILTGDEPVTVTENKMVTRCKSGIIVYQDEGRQICKNPAGYALSRPSDPDSKQETGNDLEDLFQ